MIGTVRFARKTVVLLLLGVVLLLFSSPALATGACYLVTTTITWDANGNATSTTTVTPIPCPPAPFEDPWEPMPVRDRDPTPNGVTPSGNEVACATLGKGLQRGDQAQIDLGLLMLGASSVEEARAICRG